MPGHVEGELRYDSSSCNNAPGRPSHMRPLRLALGHKPAVTVNMIPVIARKYAFVDKPLQDLETSEVDVVIPLCLEDYDVLRAKPSLSQKAMFPVASTVAVCHDKAAFRGWFKARFGASTLPAQDGSTPLMIAKPRQGEWGHHTYLVDTSDQAAVDAVLADPAMYLENYVVGPREYCMHVLFDRGRRLFAALSTYDHDRRHYVQGVSDQPSPTSIVPCDDMPRIFHELLTALDYRGAASIDYKVDETGQIKIFEVNPRIGGSIAYITEPYVDCYVAHVSRQTACSGLS